MSMFVITIYTIIKQVTIKCKINYALVEKLELNLCKPLNGDEIM